MATLLFNVDKTLLHSHSLFYVLASLFPEEALLLSPAPPALTLVPSDWQEYLTRLRRAYKEFVLQVALHETGEHPFGIFRPGLFEVMERIQGMYQKGVIRRMVFYSYHPFRPLLTFARDVIRTALCMEKDVEIPLPIECGHRTYAAVLQEESVYVVDDQRHSALLYLEQRFLLIPPYVYQASYERIAEVYLDAVSHARVPLDVLREANRFLFSSPDERDMVDLSKEPQEDIRAFLGQKTGRTADRSAVPPRGNGILSLSALLDRIQRHDLNQKHIRPSE